MLKYGPTGALSEYEYKGGVFHGVHYGDFQDDENGLFKLIDKEEEFLLKSPCKRRILFDLYDTCLSKNVLKYFMTHLQNISSRITKVAFACDPKSLTRLKHCIKKSGSVPLAICKFNPDQDTDKTWLVSDEF